MKKKSESEPKPKTVRAGRARKSLPDGSEQSDVFVIEGGAAGGVKALQDLLATIPPNSETAFVVLRLSPEGKRDLKKKIGETRRADSELHNLMAATGIATIFLDRQLRIKYCTPPVEELFNITPGDVGRPLEHFTHRLDYKELLRDAAEVLRRRVPLEREIGDEKKRVFLTRFLPYCASNGRVEGVVLNFIDITERQRAEIAVEEDLRATQILCDISAHLLTDGDMQAVYDKVLDAAVEIARADAGTIHILDEDACELVLTAAKNFPPEMTERFARVNAGPKTSCRAALAAGERIFADYDAKGVKDKDGSFRMHRKMGFASAQSTPLMSRAGKPIGMFTTHWKGPYRPSERQLHFLDLLARQAADLIVQRKTEEALRESEAKYRTELERQVLKRTAQLKESRDQLQATMDSTLEMIQVFEAVRGRKGEIVDFKWVLINHASEKVFGDVIGESLLEKNPGVIVEGIFDTFKRVVETGEPDQSVIRYAHEQFDGWFYQSTVKLGDGVATTTADITARKKAEQELLRAQEELARTATDKYRTLFNSIDEGFCIIEMIFDARGRPTDYRFLEANPAFYEQTGIKEAIGKTVREIVPGIEKFWLDVYGRIARTGEPMRFEHQFKDLNRWFEVYAFRVGEPVDNRVAILFRDIAERKRSEEALRESQERLRLLANLVPDLLWDSEPDGSTGWYNQRWMEYTGQTFEEAIGWGWVEAIHPDDREESVRLYKKAVKAGVPVRHQHRIRRHDGEYRWFVINAFPLKDKNGRIVKMYGAATDIHEQRVAFDLARESEEQMRIAIAAAELATWEWDLRTGEVFWNERHYLLFGMKPRKAPRKAEEFFSRVHPDDRRRVRDEIAESIRNKTVFDTEFCIIRQDGVSRWVSGYGRVTEETDGEPVKMSGVMFDITERKEAEIALRKSEEHLQLIMESTRDYAIITYDLDGRITRWNKGAEKIFGWTEKEAAGRTTHLIFTPEDRAAGVPEKELERSLKNGRAEDERWHIRKDGSRFYASGMMQLLRDGELQGFVKIARDETERLMSEQAQRERELLHQFVRTQEDERRRIARDIHDHLGQQLTALRLRIDSLKKLSDDGKIAQAVDEVQKAAQQIDRDVDFLAWELRPAALDDLGLRLTLKNFVEEWAKYSGIKADFHTSGLGKTQLTHEIETNLYRIAQEALNNVQKHARAQNVSVLLERRKKSIVLIIEDDGVGFNTDKKINHPKGLGLIGMLERAALLGGTFEIESAPGKGTTVFVRVPIELKEN
jgi:PAS domain S-box-containing protein